MTDEERNIWQCAHAAAFANQFQRYFGERGLNLDDSLGYTDAEVAHAVADEAVRRLRFGRQTIPAIGNEVTGALVLRDKP